MRAAFLLLGFLLIAGCDVPKDPDGSLERIRGGVLRAGITEAEPWTIVNEGSEPAGVEADLIREFAAEQGATVEWRKGSSEELLSALEHRELDVFAGGLEEKSPWTKKVGATSPYYVDRGYLGFPPGHESVETLEGLEVAVERDSWLIPILKKKGARPVELDDPLGRGVLVAASEWRLLAAGNFRLGGKPLGEQRHIMAAAAGENGLLVALESFLLKKKPSVPRMLAQSGDAP